MGRGRGGEGGGGKGVWDKVRLQRIFSYSDQTGFEKFLTLIGTGAKGKQINRANVYISLSKETYAAKQNLFPALPTHDERQGFER